MIFQPYRVVTLWELMEKFSLFDVAGLFVTLKELEDLLGLAEQMPDDPLTEDEIKSTISTFRSIEPYTKKFELPVSGDTVRKVIQNPPKRAREVSIVRGVIESEIKDKLFLHVPSYRAGYYEWSTVVSEKVKSSFPTASEELREAANCYSSSLDTACVFHSMRAAELALRVMAKSLEITFKNIPVELAEWKNIIDQIESKIKAMQDLPKSQNKSEDQAFYSEAAAQFRYFKDAWRVRVAHGHATYKESLAKEVLDHVRSFLEILSSRLSAESLPEQSS